MNKALGTLVVAQFLSAFGDNAILFTVIAIVLKSGTHGNGYVAALQSAFLIAYIVLTPWVGAWAERWTKPKVLLSANLIKALGGLSIYLGLEPLAGYAIVGIGAATYGPAKYGIIPELIASDRLVKANGWVEGATIAAILIGTVIGAKLADYSVEIALLSVIGIYVFSGVATLVIPGRAGKGASDQPSSWGSLFQWIRLLFKSQRARHVLLALSLFWSVAATLRVVLVAWAPEVLDLKTATDIAQLTLYLAIGIVVGAALVPKLIPLEKLRRTRFSAYAMGSLILGLSFTSAPLEARIVLFFIGITGGIFVVPLNAAVQQAGFETIGSGSAVAVQNFFQNGAILLSMGLYTLAASWGVGPTLTIWVLGLVVWIMTLLVSWHLIWRGRPIGALFWPPR